MGKVWGHNLIVPVSRRLVGVGALGDIVPNYRGASAPPVFVTL